MARPKDPDLETRRTQLVLTAVKNGGSVEYREVCEFYKGLEAPEKAFLEDGRSLKKSVESAKRLLSLLGFPVPTIIPGKDTISFPVRSFARLLHPERIECRRRLAQALVKQQYDGKYLIPRNAAIYLGIGSTMYELTVEIIKRRKDFEAGFHVYTQNLEVAMLLNFAAPDRRFILEFPGLMLDFECGCLVAAEQPEFIHTAVIGVDQIRRDGNIYTATPGALSHATKYLGLADNVIVFAAADALTGSHGKNRIELPPREGGRLLFVTDDEFPDDYCPPDAEHVRLKMKTDE